jgi:predicted O-methyltransferase YrrM
MMFEQTSDVMTIDKPAAESPKRHLGAFLDQAVREYRDKVMEKVLRRPLSKPWMKYREIRIIEDILRSLKPRRALEWGCGFGTRHFAGLLPKEGEWISVEHDTEWAERIRGLRLQPRTRIYTIPPERRSWTDADGTYADFRTYVDFPGLLGEFDFVLVDGRARIDCLRRAHSLLSPRGVAILHDANREFNNAPWDLFPFQASFRDYRRFSGGMWIGSKGRDVSTLADMEKHRGIWRIYNGLGRRFRL